jgi:hypothetical protein
VRYTGQAVPLGSVEDRMKFCNVLAPFIMFMRSQVRRSKFLGQMNLHRDSQPRRHVGSFCATAISWEYVGVKITTERASEDDRCWDVSSISTIST